MSNFPLLSRELFVFAILPIFLFLSTKILRRDRRKLPPGPKGLPLLGSAHEVPGSFPERTFFRWGKKYGGIVYFKIFGTDTILLSSIEAARSLLDKRSSKYSDRPRMVLLTEMIGQEASLPATPYGEILRKRRKWLYDGVGNKAKLQSYHHIQKRETRILLRNLAEEPAKYLDRVHLYLAAIMLEITYGKRVASMDYELVRVAEQGIHSSNGAGGPGSQLIDFFPILKKVPAWFPGAGFQRRIALLREHMTAWKDSGYNMVMSEQSSGASTVAPCIFTMVQEEMGQNLSDDDVIELKALSYNVYGDPLLLSKLRLISESCTQSLGVMATFFLNMTLNPRVVRKAQEELDRVVGNDRLPELSDRDSLPYLDALLEEVYRWNPPLPLAVPHRVMVDDQYEGYDIPAGSTVIGNIRAMTRDPRHYSDPEEFRPERFLGLDFENDKVPLPSSFVFGFGRRVCPGQALADPSLWLIIASILSVFNIEKPRDRTGKEIAPTVAFIPGFTSQLAPFACGLVPRSKKAAELIARVDD
ncbi:cytochrome P450 [Trametes meyenii]|nr:cytochrome P450 [Trametes meyenii]